MKHLNSLIRLACRHAVTASRRDRREGNASRRRRLVRGPRGQSGLTMIEVMVSVVVLGLAIAPAFDAMLRGRLLVAHRGEERIALRLVERKTEQLLTTSYSSEGNDANIQSVNMTAGTHPIDPTILLITRGDDDPSNDIYGDLTWTVLPILWTDPLGTHDDTNYKEVTVKLAWPMGAHRDSVVITTICG